MLRWPRQRPLLSRAACLNGRVMTLHTRICRCLLAWALAWLCSSSWAQGSLLLGGDETRATPGQR